MTKQVMTENGFVEVVDELEATRNFDMLDRAVGKLNDEIKLLYWGMGISLLTNLALIVSLLAVSD